MAELASWPLLSTLLALPVLGALAAALLRRAPWAQWIALATTVLTLLLSLVIVVVFDGADPDFQLLDTILFFFCWEFTLVPLYFLVRMGLSGEPINSVHA